MLLLLALLVLAQGTLSYRVLDTTELSNENFDELALLERDVSMSNKEDTFVASDKSDDSSWDPISINEGQETTPNIEQGDIKISELMRNEEEQRKASNIDKRNAKRDKRYLWIKKVIPYEIDAELQAHTAVILQAIQEFHQSTCLRFVPKNSSHPNYIKFVKKIGCWSFVGRQYSSIGPQEISIGTNCEHKNIIMHEILHALGFWHEQSRPDRDRYIEIYWENILEGKAHNFDRSDAQLADTLGVDYDYNSIVHYGPKALSKNNGYTITAINDPNDSKKIGRKENLSASDILKINTLYGCSAPACTSTKSLGVEYGGSLPSENFQASSQHDLPFYKPTFGRLNFPTGAWCAMGQNEYLQIDLGASKRLCSVATQGSSVFNDWVTKYSVRYSSDGATWSQIQENSNEKEYLGNSDQNTVVKHSFTPTIATRYVRFYPKGHQGNICMRVGLYGEAPFLSPWSSWTPCNRQTCKKERQRFCSSDNRAVDCPSAIVNEYGVETNTAACTQQECTAPIHGHWNRWSAWPSCAKCGLGTRIRSRVCDDPAPSFGGNNCVGSNVSNGIHCRDRFCDMGPDGCSFTAGLCTWSQSPFADVPWTRKQYSTPSSGTGPSGDHTAVDNTGFYIYLEASYIPTGSQAILLSPVQPGISSQRCLKFFYHMYEYKNVANYMGSLIVKTQLANNGEQTTLKTISGNQANQWNSAAVTFTSTNDYLIVFEGLRGTQYLSDIAIDDVQLLWGPCTNPTDVNPEPNTKPTLNTISESCDFEDNFGTWQNAQTYKQFDWTRNKGLTPTQTTGPSGDHTSRAGYYAYIETSSPRTIGQRARLQSKSFPAEYKCISLWYHMNGVDVWQLNVIKMTSSKEILLWSANENKGDQWHHGIVPITGSEPFTVIIEAVRGRGEKGDIAIDDLVVARQTCNQLKPTTSNPVSKKSCSFDGASKQCAWNDLPGSDVYWLSRAGATPNQGTGPASDHSGSGYYMYIDSGSPRKTGDKALISSPYVSPGATGQCLKFWYYIHGSQVGSLNVYKENLASSSRTNIFNKSTSQGNSWQMGSVHVTGNEDFRIVMEGIVGGQGVGDIAIDDVSFTAGTC